MRFYRLRGVPRHPGFFACVALAAGASSCASGTSASRVPAEPVAARASAISLPRLVEPARWFPAVDSSEPRLVEQDPDGSLRLVERGLRLVQHPDGRIVRAEEILPTDGAISALHLPARLGGGNLFSVTSESTTRLYRATEWTGPLVPLVRLPFESAQLAAGFDRLYAVSARTRAAVGIDPATGALVDQGPLPATAAFGPMGFSDGWLGAVEVDVRGVLVTFDAGASFHPLHGPAATPGVYEQAGRVVLGTARGGYALAPSGELERIDGPSESAVFGDLGPSFDGLLPEQDDTPLDEPTIPLEASPLGARPLEVAVLRGFPDTVESAVVVANGTLARVGLRDGRIIASAAHMAPDGTACVGVRLFAGIGFVCGEALGPTRLYSYQPPLGLTEVFELPEPRTVSPSGSGALVIHGGCPGGAGPRADTYCVVSANGDPREIRLNLGAGIGVERLVALADGRVVVLVPPGPRRSGTLTLVDRDGHSGPPRPLVLTGIPTTIQELVNRGLWLSGFVEIAPGSLSGWVVGGTNFVGLRVDLTGKVTAGTVRADAPRASFSGTVALVTDSHGGGYESVDGGANWSEMTLPVTTDVIADAPADRERGCSRVGCGLGSWLRVGWGKSAEKNDLALAREPPSPKPDPTLYVTWSLDCVPTGETESATDVARASTRTASRMTAGRAVEPSTRGADLPPELESSAWRTFLGAPGPERAPGDLGFDFGTEDKPVQLRAYAWGARGATWDRAGSWLVRVANRFTVRHALWSTAISRSAWADAADAAEAFGSEPSHRISNNWSMLQEPLEEGGVLSVQTGSSTELFVLERGRAIVTVKNPDDLNVDHLSSTAKVAGKWYVGTTSGPRSFQILGVDGGSLSAVGTYPRQSADPSATLVRTARGDALGIWVVAPGQRGTGSGGNTWFIHPVDPITGEAGAPLIVPHEALAHAPRPCAPDENGWVLVHEVSPSVAKVSFVSASETPAVKALEARLVAGPSGLCIDTLAAQVDGDLPKNLHPTAPVARTSPGTLLTLSDRATDRRWGFRCAP
jgi:hypothetical protein